MPTIRMFVLTAFFLATSALAGEQPLSESEVLAGSLDAVVPARPAARTWLFNDGAELPAPSHAVVLSRLTYSSGSSPTRPFASNLGSPGAMLEVGGDLGLLPSLSLQAIGVQGEAYQTGAAATGAQVGLRWAPFVSRSARLVLSAGYLRELTGRDGVWGRLALERDLGRARLALSLHSEHVVGAGRDGIDLMVTAGADVRVLGPVRAGIEYVGQDLEGIADPDSEGGARHIVGGVVSVRLLSDCLSLVAGPAVGLGGSTARALGRVALAYGF